MHLHANAERNAAHLAKAGHDQQLAMDVKPPLNLGIYPQFCVPHPVVLVCREKMLSWSGDDFSIKDTNGQTVCLVDGKTFSIHQTITFMDSHGNELFKLKKKLLSFFKSHEAFSPDGSMLFEVEGHFQLLGSKMTGRFTNATDGRRIELICKGNWIEKKCQIVVAETGQVVAHIERDYANWYQTADRRTYFVRVEPGVDLVLMAALAVTFDERTGDRERAFN